MIVSSLFLAFVIAVLMPTSQAGTARAAESLVFSVSPTTAEAGKDVELKYVLYVDGEEADLEEGNLTITDLDNKQLTNADYAIDVENKTLTISAAAIKPGYAYTIVYTVDELSEKEVLRIKGLTLELSNPSGTTGHINRVTLTVSENGYRNTPEEKRISITDSYGRLITNYTYDKDTRRITFPKDMPPGKYKIKYSSDPYSDEQLYNIYDTDQPSWYGGFTADSTNIPLSKAGTTVSYPGYVYAGTGAADVMDSAGATGSNFDYSKLDGSVGITGSRNFRLTSSRIDMSSGMPYVHVVLADALASGDTATIYLKLYYENKELSSYSGYSLTMVLTASDGTLENPENPETPSNTSVGIVINTTSSDVSAFGENGTAVSASLLRVVMETNGVKSLSYIGPVTDDAAVVVPATVETGGETLSVTRIGKAAFRNSRILRSIVIPSTVNRIGRGAFDNAHNLRNLTMYVYDAKSYKVKKNSFRGVSSVTVEIHCYDQAEFGRIVNKIKKAGGTNLKFVRKGLK